MMYNLFKNANLVRFNNNDPNIEINISHHVKGHMITLNSVSNQYNICFICYDEFEDTEVIFHSQSATDIQIEKDATLVNIVVNKSSTQPNSRFIITAVTPFHKKTLINLLPDKFYNLLIPHNLYLIAGSKSILKLINPEIKIKDNISVGITEVSTMSGPTSHKHLYGVEIFIVVKGRFLVTIEDQNVIINQGDIIAIAPSVYRSFLNIETTSGIIIPILLESTDEVSDIVFSSTTKHRVKNFSGLYGKSILWLAEIFGLKFENN
jgi:mannose-6-phosphate isomerase-like protein (cupin superfamily)